MPWRLVKTAVRDFVVTVLVCSLLIFVCFENKFTSIPKLFAVCFIFQVGVSKVCV